MTFIDASQAESIQERYPEVFQRSFFKRFAPLLMVISLFLYGIYAVWFFEIPKAISEGHWERVGIYLSQWVSYDVQAEFRLEGDTITPKYPRFSPLGNDPNPDWVKQNSDRTVTVEIRGPSRAVTFQRHRSNADGTWRIRASGTIGRKAYRLGKHTILGQRL